MASQQPPAAKESTPWASGFRRVSSALDADEVLRLGTVAKLGQDRYLYVEHVSSKALNSLVEYFEPSAEGIARAVEKLAEFSRAANVKAIHVDASDSWMPEHIAAVLDLVCGRLASGGTTFVDLSLSFACELPALSSPAFLAGKACPAVRSLCLDCRLVKPMADAGWCFPGVKKTKVTHSYECHCVGGLVWGRPWWETYRKDPATEGLDLDAAHQLLSANLSRDLCQLLCGGPVLEELDSQCPLVWPSGDWQGGLPQLRRLKAAFTPDFLAARLKALRADMEHGMQQLKSLDLCTDASGWNHRGYEPCSWALGRGSDDEALFELLGQLADGPQQLNVTVACDGVEVCLSDASIDFLLRHCAADGAPGIRFACSDAKLVLNELTAPWELMARVLAHIFAPEQQLLLASPGSSELWIQSYVPPTDRTPQSHQSRQPAPTMPQPVAVNVSKLVLYHNVDAPLAASNIPTELFAATPLLPGLPASLLPPNLLLPDLRHLNCSVSKSASCSVSLCVKAILDPSAAKGASLAELVYPGGWGEQSELYLAPLETGVVGLLAMAAAFPAAFGEGGLPRLAIHMSSVEACLQLTWDDGWLAGVKQLRICEGQGGSDVSEEQQVAANACWGGLVEAMPLLERLEVPDWAVQAATEECQRVREAEGREIDVVEVELAGFFE